MYNDWKYKHKTKSRYTFRLSPIKTIYIDIISIYMVLV